MKTLQTLCRICTKKLGRVSYDSSTTPTQKESDKMLIEETFGPLTDNPAIHPPRFCNSCFLTMKRMWTASQKGTVYRTSLSLHSWTEHLDGDGSCKTCSMAEGRKKGGRPKTTKKVLGCPSYLTEHKISCWSKVEMFSSSYYGQVPTLHRCLLRGFTL